MMLIGWLPSLAYSFEVDGIHYNRTEGKEVEVISKGHLENGYVGSIIIPSSVNYKGRTYDVTSIGYAAFEYCTSLTSIEIPNSVTSIGGTAFEYCSSLTSIVVDSGNTKYDSRNDCNAIIETASNTLIAGCQNTIISNSVTSIGDYAFYGCTGITSIEIPNSVTSIGSRAFFDCDSLTGIEIPNSVTSIGEYAFSGCSSLTSIEIGYGVTSIGERTFSHCDSLTSIQIPHSVTSIGDYAFGGCSNLTSIEIPNSVTSIGNSVFEDCLSLTSIVVQSYNSKYDSRNGCNAIIETASNTLIAGCQNTIIPNSVTSIGSRAFYDCDSLTGIEIPNSVTSIGDAAFADCNSLTSIEIPNSVTSIGEEAFYDCSSLSRIICTATTPPTIESDTFSEYSAFLFVPIGCKATYEVADYWENFNNIIEVTLGKPITLNDNDVIVATIGENIVVKNAMVGSVVRVYTADGALIASEVATDGDIVVEAPVKGVYVVTVGKQTVKVII